MSKFDRLKDLARAEEEVPRKMGRPLGKKSDPDWQSTTVYLKAETKIRARIKLLRLEGDLSDLLERLLSEWLER